MGRSQRLHQQAGYTFAISTQIEKTIGNREESIYALGELNLLGESSVLRIQCCDLLL
jgi:hypothetical protein